MPVAQPFTTNGVYNGFPSCFPKVDVSEFDFWTTFSGYNKDSGGEPTQKQIDQSETLAGKLFYSLEKVTTATGDVDLLGIEMVVNGEDLDFGDPIPPSIEPEDRSCGGSLSSQGEEFDPYFGRIDQILISGFARMYDGDTAEEGNFIGYGSGLLDWLDVAPIETNAFDGFVVDSFSGLGGYSEGEEFSGRDSVYAYTEIEGIHFLWAGIANDSSTTGFDTVIDEEELSATILNGATIYQQAQITGLEFWTYP